MRVPTPVYGNAEPPLDPAVQQMADYLEARAHAKMREEYIAQASAAMKNLSDEKATAKAELSVPQV